MLAALLAVPAGIGYPLFGSPNQPARGTGGAAAFSSLAARRGNSALKGLRCTRRTAGTLTEAPEVLSPAERQLLGEWLGRLAASSAARA
jgi:hypothetical protein